MAPHNICQLRESLGKCYVSEMKGLIDCPLKEDFFEVKCNTLFIRELSRVASVFNNIAKMPKRSGKRRLELVV